MGKNDRDVDPRARRPRLDRVAGAPARRRRSPRSRPPPSPRGIPIVDRDSGRVLSVLAGGRRRIVEVGTAYGYSTLWMALGQPADGTIVTIDPDRERTDLARGWWREAGIADERITVVNAPGARGVRRRRAGPGGPVRPRLHRRAEAGVPRLPRGPRPAGWPRARSSSPTTSCGAAGCRAPRPVATGRRQHRGAARVRRRRPRATRASRPRSCPSATACSSPRGAADRRRDHGDGPRPRPPVRASSASSPGTREVALDLPDGATVEAAWSALVERHPVLAPGRPSVRFARNGDYADAATALADGDEVAMIPPVSGGSGRAGPRAARGAVRRRHPRRAGRPPRPTPATAPSSGSSAGPGRRPGTPAPGPGGRGRTPRRPARRVARVRGPRDDGARHARGDRRRDRGPLRRRPASRSSIGPARCRSARSSIAVVAVAPASRRRVRRRPLRDRRDEGPGADLEGRAVRRRPCLDRPSGPDRAPTRRRTHEGLHQRRHGGHRRDQPPASRRTRRTSATRRPSS